MSDTSEDKSDRQTDKEDKDNICRDFIRGICDRKICKYKHEAEMKQLNFCHDFQNNICPRANCKFIHCTPEEEIEYKNSGVMSNHILAEATRKNQLPGAQPICNQFRKGLCRRNYCKYRHLTREEEEAEIIEMIQNNNKKHMICINGPLTESQIVNTPCNELHRRATIGYDEYEECGIQLPKRRFIIPPEPEIITNSELHPVESSRLRPVFKGYFASNPPPPMLSRVDARTLMLEEENNLLHKEIAQLKRQVSDLTATNEFLLDQNANLRVSGKRNDTVTMPAVTITNTNNPQVIRTVTASVATVPVSLATVSTCNPVSVSIAGCPTVSMASQAQLLAPSQQILVTTNTSPQLALANSSQAQLAIAQQNLANNLAAQQAQPQLSTQAQQLALATTTQQLTLANTQLANQQQQLANQQQQLANQQLTSQAQQMALANAPQLTSQAQQLASQAQLAMASVPQQLLTQNQQIEMHRNAINTSQAIAMSHSTQPMMSYPIMTQSINHALTH